MASWIVNFVEWLRDMRSPATIPDRTLGHRCDGWQKHKNSKKKNRRNRKK